MTLSSQVCSLESAKMLKELGVKQESYCMYVQEGPAYFLHVNEPGNGPSKQDYSAFTVSEIGELLEDEGLGEWEIRPCNAGYEIHIAYIADGVVHKDYTHYVVGETQAEACAKMLIHLIEKGYVKFG